MERNVQSGKILFDVWSNRKRKSATIQVRCVLQKRRQNQTTDRMGARKEKDTYIYKISERGEWNKSIIFKQRAIQLHTAYEMNKKWGEKIRSTCVFFFFSLVSKLRIIVCVILFSCGLFGWSREKRPCRKLFLWFSVLRVLTFPFVDCRIDCVVCVCVAEDCLKHWRHTLKEECMKREIAFLQIKNSVRREERLQHHYPR